MTFREETRTQTEQPRTARLARKEQDRRKRRELYIHVNDVRVNKEPLLPDHTNSFRGEKSQIFSFRIINDIFISGGEQRDEDVE